MIKKSICLSLLVFFVGCDDGNKRDTHQTLSLCDTNISLQVANLTLDVHKNRLATTTKLLNDANITLNAIDRVNSALANTLDISTQMLNKVAEPFEMSNSSSNPFGLATTFNSNTAAFTILKPLTRKYILVSSQSRFFPDNQSIKTLFTTPATLTNAWNRAITEADKNKNLYVTILMLEDNATITNLTNGLLIKSSQLN